MVRLIVTVPLAIEYEAVCSRPKHLEAAGWDERRLQAYLDTLLRFADHAVVHFSYRPVARDPDDDLVLEAAINGTADALVTFNIEDYGSAPMDYGIRCMRPAEVLKELRNG